jgi:hypothetical protein
MPLNFTIFAIACLGHNPDSYRGASQNFVAMQAFLRRLNASAIAHSQTHSNSNTKFTGSRQPERVRGLIAPPQNNPQNRPL